MAKINVTKYVACSRDARNDLDGPLIRVIEYLNDRLGQIPEEYRGSAQIYIDTYNDYGDAITEYSIYYSRPETDEEEAARIESADMLARQNYNREREQYERLKAKFEPKEES